MLNMTYEGFIHELETALKITVPKYVKPDPSEKKGWMQDYAERHWYDSSGIKIVHKEAALINSWETGGVSGGSCWDSSNPQPYSSGKVEPEWTELTEILEHFVPEITFLKYKALMGLTTMIEKTEHEYYGNHTDYAIRVLPLKTLYEFLDEKGMLPE